MMRKIGEFIKEYSVRNISDEDISVYSVTNENGFCTGYFSKDVSSKDRTTYKIVPRGYFAYNPSRINVGSIDWQNCEDRVIVSPLYVVFKVSDDLDRQYLLYYLKSEIANAYIRANGAGSVRDNLRFKALSDIPIRVVSLEEQREIVKRIDCICGLINMGEKIIEVFDLLVKSRFVEMFGDPVANNMNWDETTLLRVLEKGRNVSYGIVQTGEDVEGGIPVFRPIDIAGGHIPKIDELKKTLPEISAKYQRTILEGRELLVTVRGSVGETFQVSREFAGCNVGRNIVPLITNQRIISQRFLQELFAQPAIKNWLKSITKGIALQGLNMSEFKEMPVIIPPINMQNDFVSVVTQIDKSKLAVENELEKLEILKKSLMQEYFS